MQIAEILAFLETEGIIFSFEGDASAEVEGFSSLKEYKAGCLTWVKNRGSIPAGMDLSQVRLAVVSEEVEGVFPNVIRTNRSKQAFFAVLEHFWGEEKAQPPVGVHTYISPEVKLGRNVRIGNHCTLDGEITVGDGTVIGHNVTIINRVHIGRNCEIRSGAVLGYADAISYTEDEYHNKTMIRHFGGVRIGDDVLVGENSTVCRGTIDDTVIEDGVKLDALTQVSHNCHFEKNSVAVSASRFCGSVRVGEGAYIVGAIVRNQCRIGREAFVGMGAVVVKDVEDGQTVAGNPARPLIKSEG